MDKNITYNISLYVKGANLDTKSLKQKFENVLNTVGLCNEEIKQYLLSNKGGSNDLFYITKYVNIEINPYYIVNDDTDEVEFKLRVKFKNIVCYKGNSLDNYFMKNTFTTINFLMNLMYKEFENIPVYFTADYLDVNIHDNFIHDNFEGINYFDYGIFPKEYGLVFEIYGYHKNVFEQYDYIVYLSDDLIKNQHYQYYLREN